MLTSVEGNHILGTIGIGIGATLVMDLWNLFLKRTFSIPSLNYCLLGRWLRHMPEGPFATRILARRHKNPPSARLGWVAHYTIGVVFAVVFVVLAS